MIRGIDARPTAVGPNLFSRQYEIIVSIIIQRLPQDLRLQNWDFKWVNLVGSAFGINSGGQEFVKNRKARFCEWHTRHHGRGKSFNKSTLAIWLYGYGHREKTECRLVHGGTKILLLNFFFGIFFGFFLDNFFYSFCVFFLVFANEWIHLDKLGE